MKKLALLPMMMAVISLSACAQKTTVPGVVKTAFSKSFPGVSAKWDKEGEKYEANFKRNGSTISALFTADGGMLESETDIKKSELPTVVLTYVNSHYKGKAIKEAAKITKADGTVNYEAEVDGKDVIFDSNGNFLKEAKG